MKKVVGIASVTLLGVSGLGPAVSSASAASPDGTSDARGGCVTRAELRTVKRRSRSMQGIFQDEVTKVVGFKGHLVWRDGGTKVVRYRMCDTGAMKVRYTLRDIGWSASRVRRV